MANRGLREGDHLEDLAIDGIIILKWTLESEMKWHRQDCSGLRLEQVVGACEYLNERSGSIKCGEFLNYLKTC
jgi:hypothetical protein